MPSFRLERLQPKAVTTTTVASTISLSSQEEQVPRFSADFQPPAYSNRAEQDSLSPICVAEPASRHAERTDPFRKRRHVRPVILVLCYLPFLIIPWILTCILAVRPFNGPSYYNQQSLLKDDFAETTRSWNRLIDALNAIGVLITIPVVSALIAQGAVAYSQRRSLARALSLRENFALADRPWIDPVAWHRLPRSTERVPKYIWLAIALILFSCVRVLLQQTVVTIESITVMTCSDSPICLLTQSISLPESDLQIVGYDPEPCVLEGAPQEPIVQEVIQNLVSFDPRSQPAHLWPESDVSMLANLYLDPCYYCLGPPNTTVFATNMPRNLETGVLREHALRLNSTARCEVIDHAAFPSDCPGPNAFTTSYYSPGNLSIDVCVPGNYSQSPWTLSRDRQDITETLYINISVPYSGLIRGQIPYENQTILCSGNTTRGYFELGNYRNNYTAGPLLTTWPNEDTLFYEFNDYLPVAMSSNFNETTVPSPVDTCDYPYEQSWIWSYPLDSFDTDYFATPGPMTVAALAMFGTSSFFSTVSQANTSQALHTVCTTNNIPFMGVAQANQLFDTSAQYCSNFSMTRPEDPGLKRDSLIFSLIDLFDPSGSVSDTFTPGQALEMAMYLANDAWLSQTAAASPLTSRAIRARPGGPPAVRPVFASTAAAIAVTVVLGVQLLALLALLGYIYATPTWTAELDAAAVAELVRREQSGRESVEEVDAREEMQMRGADGGGEDEPQVF